MTDDAKALAEAHWGYVMRVLIEHDECEETVKKCAFHYVSAFVHGFKHGVESCQQKTLREEGSCVAVCETAADHSD